MLTLYVKTGCPYCAEALKKVEDLGLTIEEKNIADDGVVDELVEIGGKKQTPYLVDSEKGESMYESEAIVEYLEKEYGSGEVPKKPTFKLHRQDDSAVCEACE